jgi:hypothetical protein
MPCQRVCGLTPVCPVSQLTVAILSSYLTLPIFGRAKAQADSRWFPTAVTRARSKFRLCDVCGGQSDTGALILRVLRVSLQILLPQTTEFSLISLSSMLQGLNTDSIVK